jgi:Zn-dependent membrane protease YugP
MGPIKPIRRLGHQFGHLLVEPKLDAYEIAEALISAEVIEYVGYERSGERLTPSHYREMVTVRLSPQDFTTLILEALVRYCRAHRYEYEVAGGVETNQTNLTDHYDPSDFGV